MQIVRVEDAVGNVLCHDITKIVPGEFKGRAFKKGHIITEEDIPNLLKLGKEHLYVWELKEGFLHENDAGVRLARAVKGQGLSLTEPAEGKVNLIAEHSGMLAINEEILLRVNTIEEIVVATRNNNRPVKKGDKVASARVVPLLIAETKIKEIEEITRQTEVVAVKPFHPYQVGVITTGSEVYHGRIEDKFGPVVKAKVEGFGCKVIEHIIVPDDAEQIAQAVATLIGSGAEMILTTGGMSVDADDVTPSGIKKAGAKIVTYGAPVLPGAMLMVAYLGKVPILGLPGCVMYHKTTVFDLVLPMVLSGQTVTRPMIVKLGMGGLCLECDVCQYPACSFGTGA
ncbi:molybdopterin-binding protein [Sporomusa acidovorans]|uniref:Molybdopterin molybdenumtransferase n=1 Tax=Sporomusa acidovorans (strain ATCC 49682 / DSM 3132 / Mol) TaxID=1123286 RepID=A0ABZ3IYR2_SPOA4|nr:molybdopterin-binding protein [Sporomusa acidovorans]OZC14188.1 putative competence-damage inducible protein [Sporomusa acidovorans DSM 3132]SDE70765.1 molybdenum cofactor synthesis domain-containing protein [Sporomusa acidovorans]